MDSINFRQIHLDFHTSPEIDNIGAEFDGEQFALTLQEAGVNSINIFAKCHHGMYYYPTQIGTMHPHLNFDLLGEQMKALRRHNIRTIVYTCVAWNEDWADRHPEWLQINPEGVLGLKPTFKDDYYTWRYLCLNNHEHRDYIKRELAEIYGLYHSEGLAGFWIDIILSRRCVCPACLADMKAQGLDPQNESDLARHDRLNEITFMQEIFAYIQQLDDSMLVYFNGHPYEGDLRDDLVYSTVNKRNAMTFIDIESLPSDAWGYTHFPINVNYLNKYPQEITMMNGKFHLAWGDFGSLRNLEALEYECFRGLANGTKVCVGDQLHPGGKLDKAVYDRVGQVLRSVAEKEPWCVNTEKVVEVAVFLTSRVMGHNLETSVDTTLEGIYRVFTELRIPFDFIDYLDPLEKYKVVVLPEGLQLPENAARRVEAYLAKGGKVLIVGDGGLNEDGTAFALQGFCAEYRSKADYCPRYFRINEGLIRDVEPMDYVIYGQGQKVLPANGAAVLAYVVNPYFNRSYVHFSSHRQTPPDQLTDEPGILVNENTAYISAAIFSGYAQNAYKLYKQLFSRVLDELYPERLVVVDLPSTGELTVRKQGSSYIIHLLNYVIQRKSKSMDTIEDRWCLQNTPLRMRLETKPKSVICVPQMKTIPFEYQNGYIVMTIPEINGHQMICVDL